MDALGFAFLTASSRRNVGVINAKANPDTGQN